MYGHKPKTATLKWGNTKSSTQFTKRTEMSTIFYGKPQKATYLVYVHVHILHYPLSSSYGSMYQEIIN